MTEEIVKFKREAEDEIYFSELRHSVRNYFATHHLMSKGGPVILLKTIFFLLLFLTSYGLMISNWFSLYITLLLGVICGLASVLIVFNISHDASHNSLFRNNKINKFLTYTFDLVGTSAYTWNLAHNHVHHTYTNVIGKDIDIYLSSPLIRNTSSDPYFFFHKYQHLYATFLYLTHSLYLIYFKDFQLLGLIPKKEFSLPKNKHLISSYILLFATKLFYVFYSLIIPMMVLNFVWWKILISYIFVHFTMSILLGVVLIPVHLTNLNIFPEPDNNKKIEHSWIRHVFMTTNDYSAGSVLANFFFGGLNTHLAHHIFPNICHIHLVEITKIIKEKAIEHKLHYHNLTMWNAIKSHYSLLKKLSYPPAK